MPEKMFKSLRVVQGLAQEYRMLFRLKDPTLRSTTVQERKTFSHKICSPRLKFQSLNTFLVRLHMQILELITAFGLPATNTQSA